MWNTSADDAAEGCDNVMSAASCSGNSGPLNDSSSSPLNNATRYVTKDVRSITLGLYLVTFVFGLVGNTLVIYVIAKYRKIRSRSVSNYYIWNLAFADELFVLRYRSSVTQRTPTTGRSTLSPARCPQ